MPHGLTSEAGSAGWRQHGIDWRNTKIAATNNNLAVPLSQRSPGLIGSPSTRKDSPTIDNAPVAGAIAFMIEGPQPLHDLLEAHRRTA